MRSSSLLQGPAFSQVPCKGHLGTDEQTPQEDSRKTTLQAGSPPSQQHQSKFEYWEIIMNICI